MAQARVFVVAGAREKFTSSEVGAWRVSIVTFRLSGVYDSIVYIKMFYTIYVVK